MQNIKPHWLIAVALLLAGPALSLIPPAAAIGQNVLFAGVGYLAAALSLSGALQAADARALARIKHHKSRMTAQLRQLQP